MSETAKKVLLAVVIAVAVVAAGFQAMRMTGGDQPIVVKTIQAGSDGHTMRDRELAAQKAQTHSASDEKAIVDKEAALAGK